ncbi:MAG: RNA polymerase sigma factor [Clostridia bacterium]|nr:RNA polymerase sigma factor [Clostridia bacterium]
MDNGDAGYRRFLDGDDSGLYEIIRDYKDGLILYLNGICGNITTAEELMEDTFAKIAIKKPCFSGRSSFKTWLYAIGRNVALDHLRRESKRRYVPIDELPETADDRESLEASYLMEERRITLHRVMTRLCPDYRQVLWLVFFEGLSNSDAAEIMRKTNRQIENLLYRAKNSLKSELEKEGFVYEEL